MIDNVVVLILLKLSNTLLSVINIFTKINLYLALLRNKVLYKAVKFSKD